MLGAQIKAGISQYLAIEMTRREGQDHRAVTKYLPWLYSLPTVTQAKEFLDCVSHIRLLSWILLGSMQRTVSYVFNAVIFYQLDSVLKTCNLFQIS